ncbi:serine-type D-Ala-D-Ala carboxypeptidase [Vibrio sp. 10N.261.51.F12]|uniref:serine-type D-Ala-D-Ala carboxypeptidase n=1 Tax=Vibrio sp. 10N.261.51.F12 TaxID=3229679 RepID=UPI00354C989C
MTINCAITALLLTIASSSIMASSIEAELPEGSRNSIYIDGLSPSSSVLVSENTDAYFPPASTLKVVTALAAKLSLGDDFRFETPLYRVGNDVVIQYSGDPSFSRDTLRMMLKEAKSSIGPSFGTVWLDDSVFSGYDRAVGWPWDILGVCYSAPASAITLDGNCVQGALYTNDNGTTRINIPAHQPIAATTTARAVTKTQQKERHCDLELNVSQGNQYSLAGCVVSRTSPLPLKFAVASPEKFTRDVIRAEAKRLGITISGDIKTGRPKNTPSTPLFVQRSQPLPELLATMLRDSNNLYADTLLKTIGATYYNQPGSFNNGTEALKAILRLQANIDFSRAVLEDGSGLSRNNRVTTSQMAQVLHYIYDNDATLNLIKLLPVAGTNGTLKYRQSMRKSPIKGALTAKSGSLFGTYNMMGYGLDSAGKPQSIFVQMITDYHVVPSETKKPVVSPLTQFEQALYQQVIDYSLSLERSNNKAQP